MGADAINCVPPVIRSRRSATLPFYVAAKMVAVPVKYCRAGARPSRFRSPPRWRLSQSNAVARDRDPPAPREEFFYFLRKIPLGGPSKG